MSPATSVYVMPLTEYLGAWYSVPTGPCYQTARLSIFSGPGLAYGYGYDPATPSVTPFTVGAEFGLGLSRT